jgi:hypothetical protein
MRTSRPSRKRRVAWCVLAGALVLGAPEAAQAWIIPPAYLPSLPPRKWHVPSCVQPERGKRTVKLALEPDTDLPDLLSWIATITCRSYLLPGTIPADGKRVTIVGPELVTPEEAYRLFLGALDSIGLTVERAGPYTRIVEISAIQMPGFESAFDTVDDNPDRYVTILLRLDQIDRDELLRLMPELAGDGVHGSGELADPLVITDVAWRIRRILNIVRR